MEPARKEAVETAAERSAEPRGPEQLERLQKDFCRRRGLRAGGARRR